MERELAVVEGAPIAASDAFVGVVGGDDVDGAVAGGDVLVQLVAEGGERLAEERVELGVRDVLVAAVEDDGAALAVLTGQVAGLPGDRRVLGQKAAELAV